MCDKCKAAHERHLRNVAAPITWKASERVRIRDTGEVGIAAYIYSNGYTLVDLGGPVTGGLFNNNSTFGNAEIAKV